MPDTAKTLAELAEKCDRSVNTIKTWRTWDGFPDREAGGVFDVDAIKAWYEKERPRRALRRRQKIAQGARGEIASGESQLDRRGDVVEATSFAELDNEKRRWEIAYKKARAQREMIALDREQRSHLPVEEVERMLGMRAYDVRKRLEGMVRAIAPRVALETNGRRVHKMLEDEVRQICLHYARAPVVEGFRLPNARPESQGLREPR